MSNPLHDLNHMQKALEDNIAQMLKIMHIDTKDHNISDTPQRIAKSLIHEICKWLYYPKPSITTFDNQEWYHDIVIIKDIKLQSLCAHHFQPFIGVVHIAYKPNKVIVGLSKFSRIVDHFAGRPQVQENLTQQIYNFLQDILKNWRYSSLYKKRTFLYEA